MQWSLQSRQSRQKVYFWSRLWSRRDLLATLTEYLTRWQARNRPSLNTDEMTIRYRRSTSASLQTPSALEKEVGVHLGRCWFWFFPQRILSPLTTRFNRCLRLCPVEMISHRSPRFCHFGLWLTRPLMTSALTPSKILKNKSSLSCLSSPTWA